MLRTATPGTVPRAVTGAQGMVLLLQPYHPILTYFSPRSYPYDESSPCARASGN